MTARHALAALGVLATAATLSLGLAACGGGGDMTTPAPAGHAQQTANLDNASDAQVAYYNAYSKSAAPDAFGGTYEQAITLGDAACGDLDDGQSVANILGGADPATLEASKDVVAAAGTYLCPEHAEQVAALTEGN